MAFRQLTSIIQFFWMLESQRQQRLAWKDAAKARVARDRADAQSAAQFQAMLDAHPSGSLGDSVLNDPETIQQSGLL